MAYEKVAHGLEGDKIVGINIEFLSVQGGGLQSETVLYHDRDYLITI